MSILLIFNFLFLNCKLDIQVFQCAKEDILVECGLYDCIICKIWGFICFVAIFAFFHVHFRMNIVVMVTV